MCGLGSLNMTVINIRCAPSRDLEDHGGPPRSVSIRSSSQFSALLSGGCTWDL